MLSLLFDKEFWYLMLIIAVIICCIWLCIKFKSARLFICSVLVVAMCGFSVYAGFYINSYYSASGGIYGQLSSLLGIELEVEDMTFTFSNVELTQEGSTDTYSATVYSSEVFDVSLLSQDVNYSIFVNNKECTSTIGTDYAQGEFTYAFYDASGELLCVDTLSVLLVFDTTQTFAVVSTSGGSSTASYWRQYFTRNGFVVTIGQSTIANNTYNITTSSDYCLVSYMLEDELIYNEVVKVGETISMPNLVLVSSWSLEDGTAVTSATITESTCFYATMSDVSSSAYGSVGSLFEITLQEATHAFLTSGDEVDYPLLAIYGDSSSSYQGLVYYDGETDSFQFLTTYGYGWDDYAFLGSSLNSDYLIINSRYTTVDSVIIGFEYCFVNSTDYSLAVKFTTPAVLDWSIDIDVGADYYVYFDSGYIVYSYAYLYDNAEGVYVYDIANDTVTCIVDEGYWKVTYLMDDYALLTCVSADLDYTIMYCVVDGYIEYSYYGEVTG